MALSPFLPKDPKPVLENKRIQKAKDMSRIWNLLSLSSCNDHRTLFG